LLFSVDSKKDDVFGIIQPASQFQMKYYETFCYCPIFAKNRNT